MKSEITFNNKFLYGRAMNRTLPHVKYDITFFTPIRRVIFLAMPQAIHPSLQSSYFIVVRTFLIKCVKITDLTPAGFGMNDK
jgi:hypothetical protein